MRDAPRPGEVFEGHLIEEEIGRGGMGIVYRARNVALDRERAIKVIAPELSGEPEFAARFRRESRLAAAVDHPNVVPIHGAGEDDGLLYLVMRLVEGTDLHRLLADGALPPARAIAILRDVASGLDAAHAAGLVHRDVKPGNVLIDRRGDGEHVYLTDFGISKPSAAAAAATASRAETALTIDGQVLGTADYVAPEQVEDGRADARSDVYALACVAFHALTGRPPFQRDTDVATLIAQAKAQRPAASEIEPLLPGSVDDVLRWGMAIDPAARPADAAALVDALEAALEGVRPRGVPTPVRRGLVAGETRRRGLLAAGLAALAVAAAVAAALAFGGGSGDDGPPEPEVVSRDVGAGPVGVAVGDWRLWVASRDAPQEDAPPGQMERLRRAVPEPAKPPIPLPGPEAVAVGLSGVWVVNGEALYRLGEGEKPVRIDVGSRPDDVAVGNNYVWVSDSRDDVVTRVDPGPLEVGAEPELESAKVGDEPRAIAVGKKTVWVANAGDGTVQRIRPESAHVSAPIAVGRRPVALAVGPSSVWVADGAESVMRQVDIASERVVGDPIELADSPRGVAVGLGSIWVASGRESVVQRFDAESREEVGDPIQVGADPADIAVGETAVYTADKGSSTVTRIEP
jgi:streptogramin lyase